MTDLQNKRNKQAAKQSAMPFKTAFTVFFAAVFWLLPDTAKAVSSRTFDSMYAAAARGDVPALREAMHRGLRIDAVNRSGDTGVCAAVKRQDYRAYNAFVQAGARTNPPCLARINRADRLDAGLCRGRIYQFRRNCRLCPQPIYAAGRNAGAGQLLFPFRLCFRPADGHHPAGTGLYGTNRQRVQPALSAGFSFVFLFSLKII